MLSLREAEAGILRGDRGVLARAITLIESAKPAHRELAEELVYRLLPRTGKALRVGMSGVPGAGKSTLIEALGSEFLEHGRSLAVLAVDPSSEISGGSILGDKTRMTKLAADPRAFVRPTPARGELGGVAERTRESLLLCEAFGFDVVIVETVGVGQSEAVVAELVDTFVLVALSGAGDELQGVKRGVMELCDLVFVNKADGDNVRAAERAAGELRSALSYQRHRFHAHQPKVMTGSALTGQGIAELRQQIGDHRLAIEASGELQSLREAQAKRWFWHRIENGLLERFRQSAVARSLLGPALAGVAAGNSSAPASARALLDAYFAEPQAVQSAAAEAAGDHAAAGATPEGDQPDGSP